MRVPRTRLSTGPRNRVWRVAAMVLLVGGLLATWQFGWRSYGSFLVLRSAYEVGAPATSTLRGWMTLDYVSSIYDVPLDKLKAGLGVPADTSGNTPLFNLVDRDDRARFSIIRKTQETIAAEGGGASSNGADASETTGDSFLTALLTYSYPALALILLLGAIGAPVPTGFATVLAGVLASEGSMSWPLATGIAVVASVAGDGVGYGIGRFASDRFIARHGRLFGYSGARKERVERLFDRWGGVTVLLTRTLVSHLSSIASLLAGLSRYAFVAFVGFAFVGRVLWTAAYFGAGYFVGSDIEASSSFLANVSGFAIALGVVVFAVWYLFRSFRPPAVVVAG
jgi:membrane protein DedA with SNARE-associated domain